MRNLSFTDRLIIFMVSTVLALPLAWFGSTTDPAPRVASHSTPGSSVVQVRAASAAPFTVAQQGDGRTFGGCKARYDQDLATIFCEVE